MLYFVRFMEDFVFRRIRFPSLAFYDENGFFIMVAGHTSERKICHNDRSGGTKENMCKQKVRFRFRSVILFRSIAFYPPLNNLPRD